MELAATPLPGVFIVKPVVRPDARGQFVKPYHAPSFAGLGLCTTWAESYYSLNHKGVLRGMHFQKPPHANAKLVYVPQGRVLDVVVDLRKGPHYGQVFSTELNAVQGQGLYIPKGCAHGFYTLEEDTLMIYMVETAYAPEADAGIRWDSLDFDWPVASVAPTLSERDASFAPLSEFDTPFKAN